MYDNHPNIYGSPLCVSACGRLAYKHEHYGLLLVCALADEPRFESGEWTHFLFNGAFLIANSPTP